MSQKKGTISVETKDIFPIIKKWLYSEHDIFLRELVANGSDAITKRASFARTKNLEIPTPKIWVELDEDQKTIVITDNGIGMTEEEVEKYLAQLAFSGAKEFVEKMKNEGEANDIIGKFGLGFYSVFMVASKVEVDSLSIQDGAQAVKWVCEGETDYTFLSSDKDSIGTSITIHVNDDNKDFLSFWKLKETLTKFCDFMPYEIELVDLKQKAEHEKKKAEAENKKDDAEKIEDLAPTIINDTQPIWKKDPKSLKDEDYLNFYRKLYPMEQEPLFWIHLNVDHPFQLNGVLYFPKINLFKAPTQEKNIKLYCRQVFVSENVKEVIPEFLSLLKGAIDSPDIPLNVSRSSLQGDPNVRKISNYVVKKVAENLKVLFNKDRKRYEEIWEDIGLFVKYGCISDDKFDELMRDKVIFKASDDSYQTMEEYKSSLDSEIAKKLENKILYYNKDQYDHSVLAELAEAKVWALATDDHIDPHFMQHVEFKKKGDNEYKFSSIESEYSNLAQTENTNEEDVKIKELFEKIIIGEEKNDQKEIIVEKLKSANSVAYLKVDEGMKRFAQMNKSMGQNQAFPLKKSLVINTNNPLIQNAFKLFSSGKNEELAKKLVFHVEDLAKVSSEGLDPENKEKFVKRSQDIIQELTQLAL